MGIGLVRKGYIQLLLLLSGIFRWHESQDLEDMKAGCLKEKPILRGLFSVPESQA
jgi:hypothetical protein